MKHALKVASKAALVAGWLFLKSPRGSAFCLALGAAMWEAFKAALS
jgi:hypothetical protein